MEKRRRQRMVSTSEVKYIVLREQVSRILASVREATSLEITGARDNSLLEQVHTFAFRCVIVL